tara:strand:- start:166 stop:708 length:543 start_codon:yes stop_codon:yes gene_type:complete
MQINNDLILQWEPKIMKMVGNTYIAGMDREDVAQELRIALMKAAKKYDESKGAIFHTYLHTSLINTIRTLITKAQRHPNFVSIDNNPYDTTDTGFYTSEIAKIMSKEAKEYEEVDTDLLIHTNDEDGNPKLHPNEKEFVFYKLQGLTMDEITKKLGESSYKVRHSIREKFTDLLAETDEI